MNEETAYILKILISMIPVGLAGFLLKDEVKALFSGNMNFIGLMLLVTAALLMTGSFR
ncbi:MAG: hypothetical protein MZV63_07445 [Marinilabiliales bacterium]|nr:hypothetical protein [Marinilabiliales bacterium]